MAKAIKNYPGGKSGAGTFHTIINEIPPIAVYIEPMAGGAGVYHNLRPGAKMVLNDIDADVMQAYHNAGHGAKAILANLDYKTCIARYAYAGPTCLVYLDPPYLFSTRSCQKKLYSVEWNQADHVNFLDYVQHLKCLVIVSHYPCPLYDAALSTWRRVDFKSMTRAGLRDERLYINYPQPHKLYDYRYLGKDFTDRQRIARKVTRLADKFRELPELERQALLNMLNQKYL